MNSNETKYPQTTTQFDCSVVVVVCTLLFSLVLRTRWILSGTPIVSSSSRTWSRTCSASRFLNETNSPLTVGSHLKPLFLLFKSFVAIWPDLWSQSWLSSALFSFVSPSTFSPSKMSLHISDFLGRTEIRLAEIKKDQGSKGPITKRLLLHEVPTGEIVVRLDLQLFEEP